MAYLSIKGGSKEPCSIPALCSNLDITVGDQKLDGIKSLEIGRTDPKEALTVKLELYVGDIDLDIPVQEGFGEEGVGEEDWYSGKGRTDCETCLEVYKAAGEEAPCYTTCGRPRNLPDPRK